MRKTILKSLLMVMILPTLATAETTRSYVVREVDPGYNKYFICPKPLYGDTTFTDISDDEYKNRFGHSNEFKYLKQSYDFYGFMEEELGINVEKEIKKLSAGEEMAKGLLFSVGLTERCNIRNLACMEWLKTRHKVTDQKVLNGVCDSYAMFQGIMHSEEKCVTRKLGKNWSGVSARELGSKVFKCSREVLRNFWR